MRTFIRNSRKDYMKLMRLAVFAAILMSVFSVRLADAQQSMVFTHPDQLFFEGQDLFSKQKYVAAQERFERVMAQYPERAAGIPQEASYYHALCAAELYHDRVWYPLLGKPQVRKWQRESPWGKLFASYPK